MVGGQQQVGKSFYKLATETMGKFSGCICLEMLQKIVCSKDAIVKYDS